MILKCRFFLYRDLCARFLMFKLSESFWNRFKWILLDQEYVLEKKIIEKYLFFVEKFYFQKKNRKKIGTFLNFLWTKLKILKIENFEREKNLKNYIFFSKFSNFKIFIFLKFWKSIFSTMKTYFSSGFF